MLKVIGAGFGRTGTASLKTALEHLGFGPCYHMFEVFDNPHHVALWQGVADGQNPDWDQIYEGYAAAVDWPTSAFYKDLAAHYPHAKVILTVRPAENWHRSVLNTIGKRASGAEQPPDEFTGMVRSIIWDGIFDNRVEDKAHAIEIFERHIADVKASVPSERLLIYDVKEGWDPLCRFLGVPIPEDGPFPYLNTTEEWQQRE